LAEWLISKENSIRVENMESVKWYAFREDAILTASRKTVSGTPESSVEKKTSPTLVTKAILRTFKAGEDSNYNFGQWIWVVIQ
jgi:hypothetical protein